MSAKAAIQSLPVDPETESTDCLLSAYTPEQVSVGFLRVCRKLKIADFHFHDLRHTAASWLRMAGADNHRLAEILGTRVRGWACATNTCPRRLWLKRQAVWIRFRT